MNNGIDSEFSKSERKMRRLEKTLFDASLSTSLYNCEYGLSCIRLTDISASELYRRLSSEGNAEIRRPVSFFGDAKIDAVCELMSGLGVPLGITVGDVGCEVGFEKARGILANMCRKEAIALEGTGEGVLYLFLGFVKDACASVSSPLVLLPVEISGDKDDIPCIISPRMDREAVVNPVLVSRLRKEGIELPTFRQEKLDLEEYFEAVYALFLKNGNARRLVEDVALGVVSIKSSVLYNYLCEHREEIKASPIFKAISGEVAVDKKLEAIKNVNFDSVSAKEQVFVLGADAQQMRALLYADKGVSFVIDGAPGTGKSRTVANIIASAVSKGKRVLFLADAREPHEAILGQLRLAGLDDIALSLHGGASRISENVAGIKLGLQYENTGRDGRTVVDTERLDCIKKELGGYLSELHKKNFAINRSLYDMLALYEENAKGTAVEYTPSASALEVTESDFSAQEMAIVKYAAAISAMGCTPNNNPWRILYKSASRNEITVLKSDVTAIHSFLSDCKVILGQIYECPRLSEILGFDNFAELCEVLLRISELPPVTKEYLFAFDAKKLRGILSDAQNARAELSYFEESANGVFSEGFSTSDKFNSVFSEHSRCTRDLSNLGMTVENIKRSLSRYDDVIERLSRIEEKSSEYSRTVSKAGAALGIDLEISRSDAEKAIFVIDSVGESVCCEALFDSSCLDMLRDKACTARDIAARIAEIKNTISSVWCPDILEVSERIDIDALRDSIEVGESIDDEYLAFLQRYRSNGESFDIHSSLLLCDSLKEYNGLSAVYAPLAEEVVRALDRHFGDSEDAWNSVISGIDRTLELKALFEGSVPESVRRVILGDDADSLCDLREDLVEVVCALGRQENFDIDFSFIKGENICQSVEKYKSALKRLYSALLEATPYLSRSDETIDSVYDALSALSALGVTAQRVDNLEALVSKVFKGIDGAFADGSVDTRLLMHHVDALQAVRNMPLFTYVAELCCCNDSRKSELKGLLKTLSELCERASELEDGVTRLCGVLFDDTTLCNELCGGNIDGMMSALLPYAENLGGIESHFGRLSAIIEAKDAGIGDFVEKAEEMEIYENISESFRKSFALVWINDALRCSGIRETATELYREKIEEFSALYRASLEMNSEAVRQGIERAECDDSIIYEIIKRLGDGEGLTLRRLFELIPSSLLMQKPCLMTTLLSTAYMPHDARYGFDLVIVDDASRHLSAEAIGAISRGKQVIAVGDSGLRGELYGLSFENSLFYELLFALPSLPLQIHYRSADESLIDFSSVIFYGGRLVTFPASSGRCEGIGVEYLYLPQGRYADGVNVAEAEKCAELISEHIKRHPDKTLGVITFEQAQREAIEYATVQLAKVLPELSNYIEECETKGAPFFVKSLDELCGEVRDSIIISICYSKNGDESLDDSSLGNITEAGGVGRFNSAITSARECMRVVGSVRPVDFSLTSESLLGARVLYEYIKYACEGGCFDLGDLKAARLPARDDFRDTVADFILENGYSAVKCVGRCADYRVDIAIESSRGSGVYVAAVEFDGAYCTYAGAVTDSFITRAETLCRLGWRIYRINSLAWHLKPELERKALLEFLREVIPKDGDTECISDVNNIAKNTEAYLSQNASTDFRNTSEKNLPANAVDGSGTSTLNTEKSSGLLTRSEDAAVSRASDVEGSLYNPYGFAVYRRRPPHAVADDTAASEEILEIVRLEEPIHKELLVERIAECLGPECGTQDVTALVEGLLSEKLSKEVNVDSDGFVRAYPHSYAVARACADFGSRRAVEHISCEELSACIVGIVKKCGSYDCDEIYTEISAVLGYPHDYEGFFAPVKIAVYELCADGVIVNDDGMLRLA